MDIVDRIFDLVDKQFKEQKDFAAAVGVSDDTVSNWRRRISASCTKSKHLARIADVLGTTTDYLNYGSRPDAEHLTDEERQLLAAYRKADEKSRAMVRLALNMDSADSINASLLFPFAYRHYGPAQEHGVEFFRMGQRTIL